MTCVLCCVVCVGTDFRCIGMLSQFKVERHLEACLTHTEVHTRLTTIGGGQREQGRSQLFLVAFFSFEL